MPGCATQELGKCPELPSPVCCVGSCPPTLQCQQRAPQQEVWMRGPDGAHKPPGTPASSSVCQGHCKIKPSLVPLVLAVGPTTGKLRRQDAAGGRHGCVGDGRKRWLLTSACLSASKPAYQLTNRLISQAAHRLLIHSPISKPSDQPACLSTHKPIRAPASQAACLPDICPVNRKIKYLFNSLPNNPMVWLPNSLQANLTTNFLSNSQLTR